MSGEDWLDVYSEFLAQVLIGIMTATPSTHIIAPRSLRPNPMATRVTATVLELVEVVTVKKKKKPQKPPVRQSSRKVSAEQRSKEKMDKEKTSIQWSRLT